MMFRKLIMFLAVSVAVVALAGPADARDPAQRKERIENNAVGVTACKDSADNDCRKNRAARAAAAVGGDGGDGGGGGPVVPDDGPGGGDDGAVADDGGGGDGDDGGGGGGDK